MPAVSNRRHVKRPTVLVKKRQHKKKSNNKNSRGLWYEKFKATKANNDALARALSKEKQESQFLFTQNIELTSQLQDMGVLVNNRDKVLSEILKDSTEALKLLVQVTNCVTSTIVACQTIVGKPVSLNARLSSLTNSTNSVRRESTRRSNGKSPARGVVQPMVSGHTITKPVINLSRINMPRIRTSPNLSVIDESSDGGSLENSIANESHTPRRIPLIRLNGITSQRVEGLLPERIRLTSPRLSEENELLSDSQNRRLSNRLSRTSRHSRRISRKSDQSFSPIESTLIDNDLYSTIKSPQVKLQDVSRLLQNSHSINIRTLMESSEISTVQMSNDSSKIATTNNNRNIISETQSNEIKDSDSSPTSCESSPTYNFDPRKKKKTKNIDSSRSDDPLEGPSWLYNNDNTLQSTELSQQNELSKTLERDKTKNRTKSSSVNVSKSSQWNEHQLSKLHSDNSTNTINKSSTSPKIEWGETYCAYTSNSTDNEDDGSDNDDTVDNNCNEDDSDKCENLTNIVVSYNLKKDQNNTVMNNRMHSSENITLQRGNNEIDEDDFTMMFNQTSKQGMRNMNFDINDLNLPVLERPLINPVEVEPEPEITTTIKMITQTYHRMPSMARDNMETSLMENNTSVLMPVIRDSTIRTSSDFELNNLQNVVSNESEEISSIKYDQSIRKRRRVIRNRINSSTDSELSVTPEKISTVKRKIIRKKDPSAAKVVLQKLNESNCKTSSFNSQLSTNNLSESSVQLEPQSDSESSIASSMMSSGRPRRQKAPVNLKEPKLGTKLRRQ